MAKRIIVGISGASGIVYGVRALQLLRDCAVQTHLVMSKSAKLTLHYELDMSSQTSSRWPTKSTRLTTLARPSPAVRFRLPAC